jgi:hypothetical protein
MQDLFYTAPLSHNEARLAFPLVQMSDPTVTLRDWLAFARRWARRRPEQGGLVAVRDRRGIMYALFSYVVERDLRLEACLRISDIIAGRLPGADLDAAILFGIQELGERLGCNSILIDVPVSPEDIPSTPDLGRIVDSSFSPSAVTFLRRSPPKGDPLRAG